MKKLFMKTLSVLLPVIFIGLTLSSCTSVGSGTQFKANEDGYALYRYKDASTQTTYTVPDTYQDKAVTELAAFSLANAEYLKTLHIGKNIQTIHVWALTNCPVLEGIYVSDENPYFCSVDGVLYNKDKTALLAYPNGKTPLTRDKDGTVTGGGTITLPDTVKSIGENAFYLCTNLYSITFNEGLETIGNKAFLKCENLSAVNFPATLTEIGEDGFSYCNSLKIVEIPAAVKKIGNYGFFSTASQIEKIIIQRPDQEGLDLGKDWIPNKKDSIQDKVTVEYAGS